MAISISGSSSASSVRRGWSVEVVVVVVGGGSGAVAGLEGAVEEAIGECVKW